MHLNLVAPFHILDSSRKQNKLAHVAYSTQDYSTFNFLQWYVAEQHEEEKLFKGVLDKLDLVGEDGKAGLKGTLVTRNSAILVRTMMAGFMSGMASAFDVTPVPVISTSSDGAQQYQDVWSPNAVQGGVAKGASEGLDKLAEYYMDLADQMHPVIEIGGGRIIDMIITKGTTL